MSYRVREVLQARSYRPARKTAEAHGPHPSLVDVFERHPEWRRRLEALLRAGIPREPLPVRCGSGNHRIDCWDDFYWGSSGRHCRECERERLEVIYARKRKRKN